VKHSCFVGVGILVSAALLAGCKSGTQVPQAKTYEVKGTVVVIDSKKPSVKLDHEDIPGLMKGMVMEFDVAGPKVLDGVNVGDKVVAKLKVEPGSQTITALDKLP